MSIITRRFLLVCFALVQLVLFTYAGVYFSIFPDESKTELEYMPDWSVKGMPVSRASLTDKVTFLSAPLFLGINERDRFSRDLSFGTGSMLWFVLDRQLKAEDNVLQSWPAGRSRMSERTRKRLADGTHDGIINFLYDTGSQQDISLLNWSRLAVEKLNAAPLFAWQKRLDFVVLSLADEKFNGGAQFILEANPDTVFICPQMELSDSKPIFSSALSLQTIVVPPGIHKLMDGLWGAVSKADGGYYELDLVYVAHDGEITIFFGGGCADFEQVIDAVTKYFGRAPGIAAGSFGTDASWSDESFKKRMKNLAAKYPELKIYAGGGTGLAGYDIMQDAFGERLQPARLGGDIKL